MTRAPLVLVLLSMLVGCSQCSATGAAEGNAGSGSASGAASVAPGAGASAPRGLVVRGEPNANGEAAFVVEAHEDEQITLRKSVVVETQVDGQWREVTVRGLTLRASCEAPEIDCVELSRGGGLRPPPWNGRTGMGQCVRANEGQAVPAGAYRFVVTTCEGEHRVASEPFMIAR